MYISNSTLNLGALLSDSPRVTRITLTLSPPFNLSPNLGFSPGFNNQPPSTLMQGTGGDRSGSEKMVRLLGLSPWIVVVLIRV